MNMRTLRNTGLALLFGAGAQLSNAQTFQQANSISPNNADNIVITDFRIMEDPTPWCVGTKAIRVVSPWVTNPLALPSSAYFSLPAGNGNQTFEVRVTAAYVNPMLPLNHVSVLVDDEYCPSCTADPIYFPELGTSPAEYRYLITHQSGSAFITNGQRRFTLRFKRLGSSEPVLDIRFGAIMVGQAYTEVLGYYDTPALPMFILRDPPGDGSSGKVTSGTTTCFGQSHSVSTSQEENIWTKAKIGVAGEAGLFVTTEFELYFEAGLNLTASQSQTAEFEYIDPALKC